MQLDVSHVALEKLFHSLSDHKQSVSRDDFLGVSPSAQDVLDVPSAHVPAARRH